MISNQIWETLLQHTKPSHQPDFLLHRPRATLLPHSRHPNRIFLPADGFSGAGKSPTTPYSIFIELSDAYVASDRSLIFIPKQNACGRLECTESNAIKSIMRSVIIPFDVRHPIFAIFYFIFLLQFQFCCALFVFFISMTVRWCRYLICDFRAKLNHAVNDSFEMCIFGMLWFWNLK